MKKFEYAASKAKKRIQDSTTSNLLVKAFAENGLKKEIGRREYEVADRMGWKDRKAGQYAVRQLTGEKPEKKAKPRIRPRRVTERDD